MKATAKNIVTGKEVEVTVIADYSTTQYEVEYMGKRFIVNTCDLTFKDEIEVRAEVLENVVKNEFPNLEVYTDGNAGEDLQVFITNGNKEIITILVNEKDYEVDTLKMKVTASGRLDYIEDEKSKNVRKIVKLATLVKWLEKRIG